jgi:AraC-like DNA-binding protein/quercetin dioxygenase-like cupin family protein
LRARRLILPFETRRGRGLPATAVAIDYGPNGRVRKHRHPVSQLIYAVRGVMVIQTTSGQWVVPPTRAVWMPASVTHWIRMVGHVRMRTVYVQPRSAPGLPAACAVVAVSPLLSALILEAVNVRLPYAQESRDGRLMRLLIDEIVQLPTLPLNLPYPSDPRLRVIHERILKTPDDTSTAAQWARTFRLDPRTIHRLFVRDTGLTFGQWRRQARLLAALEMLARSERIVDIALAVGYRSPTAFSTMFHRQFGAPPTSYFEEVGSAPALRPLKPATF